MSHEIDIMPLVNQNKRMKYRLSRLINDWSYMRDVHIKPDIIRFKHALRDQQRNIANNALIVRGFIEKQVWWSVPLLLLLNAITYLG